MHMGVSTYIAVALQWDSPYKWLYYVSTWMLTTWKCSAYCAVFLLERWQMVSFKLNGYIGLPKKQFF